MSCSAGLSFFLSKENFRDDDTALKGVKFTPIEARVFTREAVVAVPIEQIGSVSHQIRSGTRIVIDQVCLLANKKCPSIGTTGSTNTRTNDPVIPGTQN